MEVEFLRCTYTYSHSSPVPLNLLVTLVTTRQVYIFLPYFIINYSGLTQYNMILQYTQEICKGLANNVK